MINASWIVSGAAMDMLKASSPCEWNRLGKPSGGNAMSHFWWFWYVLFGSFEGRVADSETLWWLRADCYLARFESISIPLVATVFYMTGS